MSVIAFTRRATRTEVFAWRRLVGSLLARVRTLEAERDQLRKELDQAAHDALHDALTGLPNRRSMFTNTPAHAFVTGIDLDGLKDVNDTLGHDAGDRVISLAGLALKGVALMCQGRAYRLGGDEFVMLTRFNPSRLLDACTVQGSYGVTASTGDLPTDLRDADVAMYAHKASRKAERDGRTNVDIPAIG